MNFEKKIKEYENINGLFEYILIKGDIPVLITAVHTMKQIKKDGTVKNAETFTKAIAMYLNEVCSASCLVKILDTGLVSNIDNHDEIKKD